MPTTIPRMLFPINQPLSSGWNTQIEHKEKIFSTIENTPNKISAKNRILNVAPSKPVKRKTASFSEPIR